MFNMATDPDADIIKYYQLIKPSGKYYMNNSMKQLIHILYYRFYCIPNEYILEFYIYE